MRNSYRTVAAALLLMASGGLAGAQTGPSTPSVSTPTKSTVSPNLSDLPTAQRAPASNELKQGPKPKPLPKHDAGPHGGSFNDKALQRGLGPQVEVQQKPRFPGIVANGYIPPDPNIAVGKTTAGVGYIVQMVNSQLAVFNKATGATVTGPVSLSSLWAPLGGVCAASNSGDPVAQYDVQADRWLITQLASTSGPNYGECVAVSQTNNPGGAYYLYSYSFGTALNDYPKFGVWPTAANSAYLATFNMFPSGGNTTTGSNICAYDRAAMLAGAANPAQVCFLTNDSGGYLPADLDGQTWPAAGALPTYLSFQTTNALTLYQITGLDFTNPAAAQLTAAVSIPVAAFAEACAGGTCIPQPGSQQLDSLGDRLMYRLGYRIFSDHSAMVINHSVVAAPGSNVGVRWYELRSPSGSPSAFSLFQQGTYAPDSASRWMGSVAMDGAGNIAVGYSKSSSSTYPSIAFTGRTPNTASGAMGPETTLVAGKGAQTFYSRWGDYTALRIDPDDDATFWYTNEYYPSNSFFNFNWSTAIASFKVGGSGGTPDFGLSASPASLAVSRGSKVTSTVTVTETGGSSSVNLSVSGLPRYATAIFSPNPMNASGPSQLTISTNSRTPRGTYTLTVTGTNGSASHAIGLTLQVN